MFPSFISINEKTAPNESEVVLRHYHDRSDQKLRYRIFDIRRIP